MLDVHPPHGKMHGVGDFFLHLFTITIGLLIALGLEDLATRHQKNELREVAEANLQAEIRENQDDIRKMMPVMVGEEKTLIALLDFITAREDNQPATLGLTSFGYSNTTLSDASWQVAVATGAVTLMPYSRAQAYAGAYQLQAEMTRLFQTTLDDFLVIEARASYKFDPTKVTAAQATAADPEVRRALSHLIACQQFAAGLDKDYTKALDVASAAAKNPGLVPTKPGGE